MKCYHTGLPRNMCAHCAGISPDVPDPFRPRRFEDEEPRLVKMRGKVEWRGLGRSLATENAKESVLNAPAKGAPSYNVLRPRSSEEFRLGARYVQKKEVLAYASPGMASVRTQQTGADVNPMGLAKGSCIRPVGFSQWARDNFARSVTDAIKALK
jgi:hypothetical protein